MGEGDFSNILSICPLFGKSYSIIVKCYTPVYFGEEVGGGGCYF